MNIDRAAAEKNLRMGRPVLCNGRRIEPTFGVNGMVLPPAELPQAGEFVALRHEDGSHTRAGLINIIESGGGVMMGNGVITDVKDLPPEEVLAAGDVRQLEAIAERQETEAARLRTERETTQRALERARLAAANPPPPGPAVPPLDAPKLGGNAPPAAAKPAAKGK